MRSPAIVLLVAACADPTDTEFPVEPSTGSAGATGAQSGGNGQPSDGGVAIAGRVCIVPDLFSTECATTGAGGLTVVLGDQIATTNVDGTFALDTTPGAEDLLVFGDGVVTTSTPARDPLQVRVLRQALFDRMMAMNGITTTGGSGSIFAALVRDGLPVEGAGATSTPSPSFGPFFDGPTPEAFALDRTGARGIVFFPGLTVGPASLTFTDLASSTSSTVGGVQVINGGVTMIETVLP